jgi:hypothetical protein
VANFQFTPARTKSSVRVTLRLTTVELPTITGGLMKRPVPKLACRYSTFKVKVLAGSAQTTHSPPRPAVHPIQVCESETQNSEVQTLSQTLAKAAPPVP